MEDMTALELASVIRNKSISVTESLICSLSVIEKKEKDINAFITIGDKAKLFEEAERLEKKISSGEISSELAGVPIVVKDNICTKDMRTTCGSKMLEHFIPQYDATVIQKLKEAGMLVIGKTNMDEFAMGSTTETSYFGAVRNPADITRTAGGSSGGSAATVAAGYVKLALGSDTGGSIRLPGAYCGVYGMKPTYGTVSRYGLIAYASSFDQIGPIAENVSDCAALLKVICGRDVHDATSVNCGGRDITLSDADGIKGMKICIPSEIYKTAGIGTIELIKKAADRFRDMGCVVGEYDIGLMKYALPAYYIIACAQAASNLKRYDGVKYGYRASEYSDINELYKKTREEGFGDEVRRRIELGRFVLSEGFYDDYYMRALKVRRLVKEAFDKAFERYDLILLPVSEGTAPLLGEYEHDVVRMYRGDLYTVPANLAGYPAMTIPFGYEKDELPRGIQLMAPAFREDNIFRAAYSLGKY